MQKNCDSVDDGLTGITSDRAREMCIDRTGETIMAKSITRYASRAEVLRRKHAPRGHDPYKRIECRFLRILFHTSVPTDEESAGDSEEYVSMRGHSEIDWR